jgi:hypothetical protein
MLRLSPRGEIAIPIALISHRNGSLSMPRRFPEKWRNRMGKRGVRILVDVGLPETSPEWMNSRLGMSTLAGQTLRQAESLGASAPTGTANRTHTYRPERCPSAAGVNLIRHCTFDRCQVRAAVA